MKQVALIESLYVDELQDKINEFLIENRDRVSIEKIELTNGVESYVAIIVYTHYN